MAAAHFLIVDDIKGGFNVCDTRDGSPIAWRGELESVAEIACALNAEYPFGSLPPAHDTLVHQVRMERIGEGPGTETPLAELDRGTLARMVPAAVGDPRRSELWARVLGLPDDEEVV